MKVSEAMTTRVRSCKAEDSLESVMRILWDEDIGALPVVNDEGQPIAVITDRDVAVAAYTQGRPLSQIQVRTAMSRQLHTVHVSDKIGAAERSLRLHQVRRLPVVDESTRLVGVVSLADIARLESRATEPRPTDAGATLAAISRPRRGSEPAISEETRALAAPRSVREPARATSNARSAGYGGSSSHARR